VPSHAARLELRRTDSHPKHHYSWLFEVGRGLTTENYLLNQILHAVLEDLDAAHTRAHQHTYARLVKRLESLSIRFAAQAAVSKCFLGSNHCVLQTVIITAFILPVN
jgi:hypothetical protein